MGDPREVRIILIRARDIAVGERFRLPDDLSDSGRRWRELLRIQAKGDRMLLVWCERGHFSTGSVEQDWSTSVEPDDLLEVQSG